MSKNSNVKKTKKGRQVFLIVNVAYTLNFISKKNAGEIFKQYKKDGDTFDTESYMLEQKFINKQTLSSLKKATDTFGTIQDDTRFGSLCTSFDFLTEGNLDIALEEQKLLQNKGDAKKLGDLLSQAGMLSKGQRDLILIKQKANQKTGEGSGTNEKKEVTASDIDISNMRKIKSDDLLFLISDDLLAVYLQKTEEFDPDTSIEDLKKIISDLKIIHGVVNDGQLQIFLNSKGFIKEKYFTLAVGDEPVSGIDAIEKIHFKEEYKDAGKISIDGRIDYKERGNIPIVKTDGLLAEKIPAQKGEAGLNVFDEFIPPGPPKDFSLKFGKGVKISEDGLRIYAAVNGYPQRDAAGKVIVKEVFVIDGDVDYETGHVNYDKSVNITGTVKNGFKVNAIDIVVNEVDGGFLHAKGNVLVKKGIIDARVSAKGTVTAGYISRSKIACFGDIEAVKEISDSEILSDGECRVSRGKIFASSITAKRGVEIRNIGSEKAKRVSITVGTSPNYNKKSKEIKTLIENAKNELKQIASLKNNTLTQIKKINSAMSQISASTQKNQELIKTLYSRNNNETEILQLGMIEANENLKNLEIEKVEIEDKLQKLQDTEANCTQLIEKGIQEQDILKKIEQDSHPKPVVKVEGTLVSGSFISGRYSKVIINKNRNRVKIMEVKSTENDPLRKNPWEMVIASL
jgi:uncharacterized protein